MKLFLLFFTITNSILIAFGVKSKAVIMSY